MTGDVRYTYVDEEKIDIELKCTICDEPFQSPVNCLECGNTFCQACIQSWAIRQTSCPSCRKTGSKFGPVLCRVVLNQLNRLIVRCTLCDQRDIQRSNLTDHLAATCPKQTVTCTDQCGWQGLREVLDEHLLACRQRRSSALSFGQKLMVLLCLILAVVFCFALQSK